MNGHILSFDGESETIVRYTCYISVVWKFHRFLPNDRQQFLELKDLFSGANYLKYEDVIGNYLCLAFYTKPYPPGSKSEALQLGVHLILLHFIRI